MYKADKCCHATENDRRDGIDTKGLHSQSFSIHCAHFLLQYLKSLCLHIAIYLAHLEFKWNSCITGIMSELRQTLCSSNWTVLRPTFSSCHWAITQVKPTRLKGSNKLRQRLNHLMWARPDVPGRRPLTSSPCDFGVRPRSDKVKWARKIHHMTRRCDQGRHSNSGYILQLECVWIITIDFSVSLECQYML